VGDVEKQCDGDRVSVLDLRVRAKKMDEGSGRTREAIVSPLEGEQSGERRRLLEEASTDDRD
jgi:hypothetical protein